MPGMNTPAGLLYKEEILEHIVGTSPDDPSWELQVERILGTKTKRYERRVQNEYHKQTQQHRGHQSHNR